VVAGSAVFQMITAYTIGQPAYLQATSSEKTNGAHLYSSTQNPFFPMGFYVGKIYLENGCILNYLLY